MGSFHDQWMDAWTEMRAVELVQRPATYNALRDLLHQARELIDEDNTPTERRCGGQLIREVRQECRRIRESAAA